MAARYLVPGGTGDFNSNTNWSTTSGGASGASFPTLVDDIIIDTNSANAPITVNVLSACKSFTASNYTGTWTITNNLSVNGTTNTGNITLSSGMTITGVGTFIKVPTGTTGVITSNGVVFDCNFTFQAAGTTTTNITGAMQVNKNLTYSLNSTNTNTVNGSTISVGGNIIHNSPVAGTSTHELIGSTAAVITQVATRYLGTNLVINKGAGAFNQVDLYWGASGRTLTYTSGLVNHTGTLFTIANSTLNTSGIIWNIIRPSGIINFTSLCNANLITGTAAPSFRGTFGFNINDFQYTLAGSAVEFESGLTYVINSSIFVQSTNTTSTIIRARLAGNTILNVKETASVKLNKTNIQKITASNKTIRVLNSTIDVASDNVFTLNSNITQYSSTR